MQLEQRRRVTLAAGCSGSGKTTFLLRYLNADKKLACRFLFDAEGEFAVRLKLPAAESPEELALAVGDGWAVFDPHAMFPGDLPGALEWFCQWVFAVSERLGGRKCLLIDEVWKYCSPNAIPPGLATCIQTGRKRGLEMAFATQRPNRLNEAITNEVSELVAFRLAGRNALARAEEFGLSGPEVAGLVPGAFVALNADSGREIRGSLW